MMTFDGSNFVDIMNFTNGLAYISCKTKVKLLLRIPLEGVFEVKKGNKIIKESTNKYVISK